MTSDVYRRLDAGAGVLGLNGRILTQSVTVIHETELLFLKKKILAARGLPKARGIPTPCACPLLRLRNKLDALITVEGIVDKYEEAVFAEIEEGYRTARRRIARCIFRVVCCKRTLENITINIAKAEPQLRALVSKHEALLGLSGSNESAVEGLLSGFDLEEDEGLEGGDDDFDVGMHAPRLSVSLGGLGGSGVYDDDENNEDESDHADEDDDDDDDDYDSSNQSEALLSDPGDIAVEEDGVFATALPAATASNPSSAPPSAPASEANSTTPHTPQSEGMKQSEGNSRSSSSLASLQSANDVASTQTAPSGTSAEVSAFRGPRGRAARKQQTQIATHFSFGETGAPAAQGQVGARGRRKTIMLHCVSMLKKSTARIRRRKRLERSPEDAPLPDLPQGSDAVTGTAALPSVQRSSIVTEGTTPTRPKQSVVFLSTDDMTEPHGVDITPATPLITTKEKQTSTFTTPPQPGLHTMCLNGQSFRKRRTSSLGAAPSSILRKQSEAGSLAPPTHEAFDVSLLAMVPHEDRDEFYCEARVRYCLRAVWTELMRAHHNELSTTALRRRHYLREGRLLVQRVASRLHVGRGKVRSLPDAPTAEDLQDMHAGASMRLIRGNAKIERLCTHSALCRSLDESERFWALFTENKNNSPPASPRSNKKRASRLVKEVQKHAGARCSVLGYVAKDDLVHVELSGGALWLPRTVLVRDVDESVASDNDFPSSFGHPFMLNTLIRERALPTPFCYAPQPPSKRNVDDLPAVGTYISGYNEELSGAVGTFCDANENEFFLKAVTQGGFAIRSPGRCLAVIQGMRKASEVAETLKQASYAQQVTMKLIVPARAGQSPAPVSTVVPTPPLSPPTPYEKRISPSPRKRAFSVKKKSLVSYRRRSSFVPQVAGMKSMGIGGKSQPS